MSEGRAPDAGSLVVGPLIGWRTWALSGLGSDIRLRPVIGHRRPWEPREATRALCGKWRLHRAPAPDCTCGLYATRDPELLKRTKDPAAIGTVAMWGTVVEHAFGYRARFAYPGRIRLVCSICFWRRGLGASHDPTGVAVFRRRRLMPLCGPHLDTTLEVGVPVHSFIPAGAVVRALLDVYSIDALEPGEVTASTIRP